MSKLKKRILGLLLVTVMVMGTMGTAFAQATSELYTSPRATAGSWWSGYDIGKFVSMTSSYSTVYGGDTGLYFYGPSVGLPNSYVRSTARYLTVELKEEDSESGNDNELVRTYKLRFTYNSNTGLYSPNYTSNTYTNKEDIETNNVLELYIRFKVDSLSADLTKNIPQGLFRYRYWVN